MNRLPDNGLNAIKLFLIILEHLKSLLLVNFIYRELNRQISKEIKATSLASLMLDIVFLKEEKYLITTINMQASATGEFYHHGYINI